LSSSSNFLALNPKSRLPTGPFVSPLVDMFRAMPSHRHEVLVEMFRDQPLLAAEVLRGPLNAELPDFDSATVSSGELTDVIPTEYRADAVVILTRVGGVLN
jgi:hypothetical protein